LSTPQRGGSSLTVKKFKGRPVHRRFFSEEENSVTVTLQFETAGKTTPGFNRRLTLLKSLRLLGQAGLFGQVTAQVSSSIA
jgi:hypothetical protein